jgi:hypothetical protein
MGGALSKPHDRFPGLFSGSFWKEYPYFLPCLATSSFVIVAFFITLVFFKEVRLDVSSLYFNVLSSHFLLDSYNKEPSS